MTVKTFEPEIREALKSFDKFVVCLERTPDELAGVLQSLVGKAITAYEGRGPSLRHGIALDKHITVILSQTDDARPLCGIYFNLHSPYARKTAIKNPKPAER